MHLKNMVTLQYLQWLVPKLTNAEISYVIGAAFAIIYL
jgi:hypothetical protein